MSFEYIVSFLVENELALSKAILWEAHVLMCQAYLGFRENVAAVVPSEWVAHIEEEFAQHHAMFRLTMEEQDLYELKRMTTCIDLFRCKIIGLVLWMVWAQLNRRAIM